MPHPLPHKRRITRVIADRMLLSELGARCRFGIRTLRNCNYQLRAITDNADFERHSIYTANSNIRAGITQDTSTRCTRRRITHPLPDTAYTRECYSDETNLDIPLVFPICVHRADPEAHVQRLTESAVPAARNGCAIAGGFISGREAAVLISIEKTCLRNSSVSFGSHRPPCATSKCPQSICRGSTTATGRN